MDVEQKVWAGWLVAVVCSFAALEFSMRTKLCTCLRRWLRIHPQRPGHRVAGIALCLGAAWLVAHLLDQRKGSG